MSLDMAWWSSLDINYGIDVSLCIQGVGRRGYTDSIRFVCIL